MKKFINLWILISLMMLIPVANAIPIFTVEGPDQIAYTTQSQNLAQGFELNDAFYQVKIKAQLSTSSGIAYLLSSIGLGTTNADIVAQTRQLLQQIALHHWADFGLRLQMRHLRQTLSFVHILLQLWGI